MQVYIVQCEYSTEDDSEIKLHVFDSFAKGYQKFKDLIADEMNPKNSWIGDLDWKDGQPPHEYEFLSNEVYDENQCQYWHVTDTDNVQYHILIQIQLLRRLPNMQKVYVVRLEKFDDEDNSELHIFETFDNAYLKFRSLIQKTMTSKNSWVSTLKWKNGIPPIDYYFSCTINNNPNIKQFWCLHNNCAYAECFFIYKYYT